jgi:hypothetical protein
MKHDLLNFYREMESANIRLAFKGALSQEILTELSAILKKQLQHNPEWQILFGMFVEMAQNILNYSAEKSTASMETEESGMGVITISETDTEYSISSGNAVSQETGERLAALCQMLNQMDKDELKRMYQQRLRSEPPEGSKGAGVGLIDMARKADFPLEYYLQQYKQQMYFFILNVKLDKS